MFADDIVLLSTRRTGMQHQLDLLKAYCDEKYLTVNMSKTKMLCFACRKARGKGWKPFMYGGEPVQQDTKFVYLGMEFHTNRSFSVAATDNLKRASACSWRLVAMLTDSSITNSTSVITVWEACVLSKMLYATEIWAPSCRKTKWEEINRLQTDFLRQHLGIRETVCTANLSAELGKFPLEITAMIRLLKFTDKIEKRKESSLEKQALQLTVRNMAEKQRGWLAEVWNGLTGGM